MAIDLQQGLTQQQTLSPQMRQGLELLQTSSLELSQVIQQALETNPVLDQASSDSQLEDDESMEDTRDFESTSGIDDEYRESLIHNSKSSTAPVDQDTRDFFYNSIVAPQTLQQHLINQLNLAGKPPELYTAGETIIGSLDDRGFLTESIEEIASRERTDPATLSKAVAMIQGFTPPGIAAEDIKESLLIQLAHKGVEYGAEHRIIETHLKELSQKRLPEIAKSLNLSLQSVVNATEIISSLTPNPGATFDPTHNPQILPDILITFDKDQNLQAHLTDAYIPQLSISSEYKELLSSTPDSEVRKYIKENIRDGRTLIKSLGQRQETLLKIAEVLMEKQKDFFSQGAQGLKPLTMNELAELIEVHPTTVSRACTSKYVLTPQGIFELRYFFTAGVSSQNGESVSNTSIRDTIKEVIDSEDSKSPLSDSAIERILKKRGISVARRTIAKYRDQLKILPSNLRKNYQS